MYKGILLLILVVTVVKSQSNSSSMYDYINMNRRQYASNVKDYDLQISIFEKSYEERINTINITTNMLEQSLIQNDERLNPLGLLNDFSRKCVTNYRGLIPTIAYVKSTINNCILAAKSQLISLLANPRITRNNLDYYYVNTYETDIKTCNKTYINSTLNHTICVTRMTSAANIYTVNNQKTFEIQMDASDCSAKAHIKKALDCSFSVQNYTISLTAQANTLIDRCLQGLDNCGKNFNFNLAALN